MLRELGNYEADLMSGSIPYRLGEQAQEFYDYWLMLNGAESRSAAALLPMQIAF